MPRFELTGPDNKQYWTEGPEGSTREDALRMAPQLMREGKLHLVEPTAMEKIGGALGTAREFSTGLGMGALRGAEAFPGQMASLIGMGGELLESSFPAEKGTPRYEAEQQREQFRKENPLPMATAGLPHATSEAGKLGESIGEFALATAVSPGSAVQRVMAAVAGGGGARLGEILTDAPYGRIIGGFLGAFSPSALTRAFNPFPARPPHQAAVRTLEQEGVTGLTAGERSGNRGLRYMESHMGESPLAGEAAAERLELARQQFTGAALARIGEHFDPNAPDLTATLNRAGTRNGNQFDQLAARNDADPRFMRQYMQDLAQARDEYEHLFVDPLAAPKVNQVWEHAVNKLQQRGTMTGEEYKALRSRLERMRRGSTDPELKAFLANARNAADDLMERSIGQNNVGDLGAWREVRNTYRNLLALEAATTGAGTGNLITPAKLRQSVVAQGRRAYARGQGDFADLARAGERVLGHLPQSGTAPRTLTGAGLIKLGSAGVTGRALMSSPVQRWFGNQALTDILRQMPRARTSAGQALTAEGIRQGESDKPISLQELLGTTKRGSASILNQFNPIGSAAAMEPPGEPGDPLGKRPKFEQGGTGRGSAGGSLQDLRPAFDQVKAEQGGKIGTVHIGDLIQRSNLPPSQVKDILREAAARGEVQLGFGNRARSALSPQQAKGIMKIGDEEFAVVTFK